MHSISGIDSVSQKKLLAVDLNIIKINSSLRFCRNFLRRTLFNVHFFSFTWKNHSIAFHLNIETNKELFYNFPIVMFVPRNRFQHIFSKTVKPLKWLQPINISNWLWKQHRTISYVTVRSQQYLYLINFLKAISAIASFCDKFSMLY